MIVTSFGLQTYIILKNFPKVFSSGKLKWSFIMSKAFVFLEFKDCRRLTLCYVDTVVH